MYAKRNSLNCGFFHIKSMSWADQQTGSMFDAFSQQEVQDLGLGGRLTALAKKRIVAKIP